MDIPTNTMRLENQPETVLLQQTIVNITKPVFKIQTCWSPNKPFMCTSKYISHFATFQGTKIVDVYPSEADISTYYRSYRNKMIL